MGGGADMEGGIGVSMGGSVGGGMGAMGKQQAGTCKIRFRTDAMFLTYLFAQVAWDKPVDGHRSCESHENILRNDRTFVCSLG